MLSVLIGISVALAILTIAVLVILAYILKTLNGIAAVYTTTYLISSQVDREVRTLSSRLWKLLLDMGYPVTFDYLESGDETADDVSYRRTKTHTKGAKLASLLQTKRSGPSDEPEEQAEEEDREG